MKAFDFFVVHPSSRGRSLPVPWVPERARSIPTSAALLEYAGLRGQATVAAKVGLFLERHRDGLGVKTKVVDELQALRPRQPHYLDRSAREKLVATWNLIVPPALLEGEWTEQGDRNVHTYRE